MVLAIRDFVTGKRVKIQLRYRGWIPEAKTGPDTALVSRVLLDMVCWRKNPLTVLSDVGPS